MIRISYDGYGCHNIDSTLISEFSFDDSNYLISAILSNDLESSKVDKLLKAYFRENKEFLWGKALKEYELI
ncbi:hypothetical protein GCM10023151_16450 [Kangiella marina]|uniref:KTSC domain-containing protein n=1 Tax=Kangiella marina TaxID=1079178 RepID=A0ABP8ILF4_9GAMM